MYWCMNQSLVCVGHGAESGMWGAWWHEAESGVCGAHGAESGVCGAWSRVWCVGGMEQSLVCGGHGGMEQSLLCVGCT